MTTIIDDASVHEIAAWRRKGHGIWYILFAVEGYDEDFVMRKPGNLSEHFATQLARIKLARALKLGVRYVIHRETAKES